MSEVEPKMVYDKTTFPKSSDLMREDKEVGHMIYNRSEDLKPDDYTEEVRAAAVPGKEGEDSMVYDKTWEDRSSPNIYKVVLPKLPSEVYPEMPLGKETMTFSATEPYFLGESLKAFEKGNDAFTKTIDHHAKSIVEGSVFKSWPVEVQSEIRDLISGLRNCKTEDELGLFWKEKVSKFYERFER